MLIAFTTNQFATSWVRSQPSYAKRWGEVKLFSATTKEQATKQLGYWLCQLRNDEPLCLTGFGTGNAFGFEHWFKWQSHELARILMNLPLNYRGDIYFDDSQGLSSGYVNALVTYVTEFCVVDKISLFNNRAPTGMIHAFPDPKELRLHEGFYQCRTLERKTVNSELEVKTLLTQLQRAQQQEEREERERMKFKRQN